MGEVYLNVELHRVFEKRLQQMVRLLYKDSFIPKVRMEKNGYKLILMMLNIIISKSKVFDNKDYFNVWLFQQIMGRRLLLWLQKIL